MTLANRQFHAKSFVIFLSIGFLQCYCSPHQIKGQSVIFPVLQSLSKNISQHSPLQPSNSTIAAWSPFCPCYNCAYGCLNVKSTAQIPYIYNNPYTNLPYFIGNQTSRILYPFAHVNPKSYTSLKRVQHSYLSSYYYYPLPRYFSDHSSRATNEKNGVIDEVAQTVTKDDTNEMEVVLDDNNDIDFMEDQGVDLSEAQRAALKAAHKAALISIRDAAADIALMPHNEVDLEKALKEAKKIALRLAVEAALNVAPDLASEAALRFALKAALGDALESAFYTFLSNAVLQKADDVEILVSKTFPPNHNLFLNPHTNDKKEILDEVPGTTSTIVTNEMEEVLDTNRNKDLIVDQIMGLSEAQRGALKAAHKASLKLVRNVAVAIALQRIPEVDLEKSVKEAKKIVLEEAVETALNVAPIVASEASLRFELEAALGDTLEATFWTFLANAVQQKADELETTVPKTFPPNHSLFLDPHTI